MIFLEYVWDVEVGTCICLQFCDVLVVALAYLDLLLIPFLARIAKSEIRERAVNYSNKMCFLLIRNSASCSPLSLERFCSIT